MITLLVNPRFADVRDATSSVSVSLLPCQSLNALEHPSREILLVPNMFSF